MNGNPFTPQQFDKLTAQEAAIQQRVAKDRQIPLVSYGEALRQSSSQNGEARPGAAAGQVVPEGNSSASQGETLEPAKEFKGGGGRWGIIIKLLILLVLAWIVFWFNYFGLIYLNQYLPWLPTASLKTSSTKVDQNIPKEVTSQPNISTVLDGQLPCPSIKEFCLNGQDVIKNGAYAGLGAKVASASAIYAVFDGDMTVVSSIYPPQLNREKIAAIYLDNKEKNLRAAYFFKGDAPVAKKVKAGEIIGKTGGELVSYNNVSLLFQLIKGDPVKGERLQLSPQDFAY